MKTLILIPFFTFFSLTTFCQTMNDNNPKQEYSIKNGTYDVTLFKEFDPVVSIFTHKYSIEFDTIPSLDLPDGFKMNQSNNIYNPKFRVEITERTKATITVVERKIEGGSLVKKHTYVF